MALNKLTVVAPEEGGWHTGFWIEASWRLHADVERVLHPTHWLPAPSDVVVE